MASLVPTYEYLKSTLPFTDCSQSEVTHLGGARLYMAATRLGMNASSSYYIHINYVRAVQV
jgi:hypothetical protein